MVTLSQSRAQSFQKIKPLKILSTDGIAVDGETLMSIQHNEKSLQKGFTLVLHSNIVRKRKCALV